ncbi:MAG: cytochrome c nitrite reductase small subunit, partial [Prevotella sp.]|nr:cytochrome c nitrite reductase small subunit [Prevotella sp.]
DGMKHTAYFVANAERQAPMAETMTGEVVMDNCIRCHTQLNQEFVNTGRLSYMQQQAEGGKVCWDCHRSVPHGGMNSLMATPNAEGVTPLPPSPVPDWLQNLLSEK